MSRVFLTFMAICVFGWIVCLYGVAMTMPNGGCAHGWPASQWCSMKGGKATWL
jgi:hypothetical protein